MNWWILRNGQAGTENQSVALYLFGG